MINQNSHYVSNLKFDSSGVHTRYRDFLDIWNVCTWIPSIICMFRQNTKKSIFKQELILSWGCEVLITFCNVGGVGQGACISQPAGVDKKKYKEIFYFFCKEWWKTYSPWDLRVWSAATVGVLFFFSNKVPSVMLLSLSALPVPLLTATENMFNLTQIL